MKKYQVYQIRNNVSGKLYIGYTSNYKKRWAKHIECANKKLNRCLYDAMNKYGLDNFEIDVLFEYSSKEEATSCEIQLIQEFNTLTPNGYNMTLGGDGGNTLDRWSDENKKELYKKQGLKRKGQSKSETTKNRISKSLTGRIIDDEWKNKISLTMKERNITPPPHTFFQPGHQIQLGYKHTEESKKKISHARIGKTYEEIVGKDRAIELKECARRRMSGKNNHQFVNILDQTKKEIVELLSEQKIIRKILCEQFKLSPYKLRQWMKEIGIDNYQNLYKETDVDQWKEFWKDKLCLFH